MRTFIYIIVHAALLVGELCYYAYVLSSPWTWMLQRRSPGKRVEAGVFEAENREHGALFYCFKSRVWGFYSTKSCFASKTPLICGARGRPLHGKVQQERRLARERASTHVLLISVCWPRSFGRVGVGGNKAKGNIRMGNSGC